MRRSSSLFVNSFRFQRCQRYKRSSQLNTFIYSFSTESSNRQIVALALSGIPLSLFEKAQESNVLSNWNKILSRTADKGSKNLSATIVPSYTLNNAIAILTGREAEENGLMGSVFLDENHGTNRIDEDSLKANFILSSLEKNGVKTAIHIVGDLERISNYKKEMSMLAPSITQIHTNFNDANIDSLSFHDSLDWIKTNKQRGHESVLFVSFCSSLHLNNIADKAKCDEAHLKLFKKIDEVIGFLDSLDCDIGVTLVEAMNEKITYDDKPNVIFLKQFLKEKGIDCDVLLPSSTFNGSTSSLSSSYLNHPVANVGSFVNIYLKDKSQVNEALSTIRDIPGVETSLSKKFACNVFKLPPHQVGDLIACCGMDSTFGIKEEDKQLLQNKDFIYGSGGISEATVPMFFNRPLKLDYAQKLGKGKARTYHIIDFLLHGFKKSV